MSRHLLASFLEYALAGKVTAEEARRFCNEKYTDPAMSDAIKALQTLTPYSCWSNREGKIAGQHFPRENAERILEIVKELRAVR